MLTFTFVAVWLASLAHAKHYQCSWDVLQGKKPAEAGFSKLCDPQLTEFEELGFYHCVLDASLDRYNYQIASWNVKPGELEWGPPCPADSINGEYGANPNSVYCRANSWLFCAGGECWGCDKSDDCAFKKLFQTPPRDLSVWYKTNGK